MENALESDDDRVSQPEKKGPYTYVRACTCVLYVLYTEGTVKLRLDLENQSM